jgi:hypothetical protein
MTPADDPRNYPGRLDIPEADVQPSGGVLSWPAGPAHRMYVYSGIARCVWQGTGSDWNRAIATIHLPAQWADPVERREKYGHNGGMPFA